MNLMDCYRLLGLHTHANLGEVKASYRRLARQYHPDFNPHQQAAEQFIQLTEAYKTLLKVVPPSPVTPPAAATLGIKISVKPPAPQPPEPAPSASPVSANTATTNTDTAETTPEVSSPQADSAPDEPSESPDLTPLEQQLKQTSYQQLHELLKRHKFPRATALAEALALRLPNDPEVRQWQAITYHRWGRYLIKQKQIDKARIYLKKSLRTDPHNRALWAEVEADFRRLEKVF